MAAKSLPQVKIQNLGGAQTSVPFTFGQPFAPGDLAPTDGLVAGTVPLQVDVKAIHPDGSVRHAILSGVLPKLVIGETVELQLAKASRTPGPQVALLDLNGISGTAVFTIDGKKYSCPTNGLIGTPWLAGDLVGEWHFSALLVDDAYQPHPNLTARFGVRYYPAAKQVRVEFIIENTKTWVPAQKFTYDVDLQVAGKSVYSKAGLVHYHRARWHRYAWTGAEPQINIVPDAAYIVSTRAVPNYELANVPWEGLVGEVARSIGEGNTGPMTIGPITNFMPQTGGRLDIGSLPSWAVQWLLSGDKRLRDVMLAAADGSGTWSMHMRDETTGHPVRTDNPKNATISTHGNISSIGPLPVPRSVGDVSTPYAHDTAHQPSLAYLPYLTTGEHYYLEELLFWAASNPLETAPEYHAGKGLVRWQQERGQAWSTRTLGHAAYITPDDHPLKAYFLAQLDANLDFYNATYAEGKPNELGVYDGSGENAFKNDHNDISPWQDDFFTWSIGYLSELGFTKADPILQWKAKYPVGRMTDSESCWIAAADYSRPLRGPDGKVFKTLGEQYRATYGGDTITFDNVQPTASMRNGVSFIDLPCGSQEQADFLTSLTGWTWERGRMFGYSDFEMGYPANLQPALAVSVNAGVPKSDLAWSRFMSRAAKPDYRKAPQWAILPWSAKNEPVKYAPQTNQPTPIPAAPSTPLVVGAQPKGEGTWAKVAGENAHIKVEPGTFVKLGADGKGWLFAQAKGEFDATLAAFGGDPAPGVVKAIYAFTPAPVKVVTLKTPSNTLLKKLKDLVVKVVDPKTLQLVSKFSGAKPASTGSITVSGTDLTSKAVYAVVVEDAAGNVIDIMFPVTAT